LKSAKARSVRDKAAAFLNVPYDIKFEGLYLAFIAGQCGFGLIPHATLEIPGSGRRLDRIMDLIRRCEFSFHDLSRVELDPGTPHTPRFNMPFELGLALAIKSRMGVTKCFIFEAEKHRLKKSLSDLDGTDPYIHEGKPEGVLRELTNALYREENNPALDELREIYKDLRRAASKLKSKFGGSLFAARPFRELVMVARMSADRRISFLKRT
jgi:hypothetical protein